MPKHLTVDDTTDFVTSPQLGAVNGVAQLGADGKVPNDQLPAVLTGSVDSVNGRIGNVFLNADDVSAVALTQKGAPSGVPQLDTSGRIPATQLPLTIVQNDVLGEPGGIATLNSSGKLTSAQVPTAPVTSVNGKTGALALNSTDVGALPTTQKGAANGLATLDSGTKIPIAQIPSLISQYHAVPATTPTKPGMNMTAIAGGSNSAQWTEPLVYTATLSSNMPTGVPNGSMCVRIDQKAIYQYISNAWVPVVPYETPWTYMSLPSGTRGFDTNAERWRPRIRRIGNQVFMKGRIEQTNLSQYPVNFSLTVPSDCIPVTAIDVVGTCTTTGGQIGVARWQLNETGIMQFSAGTGPNPATTWLGWNFSYHID